MSTCNTPLEGAIKELVSSDDLTEDQKVRAISDAVRECNEVKMIRQLEKLNMYFSMITGCNL